MMDDSGAPVIGLQAFFRQGQRAVQQDFCFASLRLFDQQLAQLLLGCYPPRRAPIPNIECSPKRGFRCRQPPEGCPCQRQVLQ